MAMGSAGEHIDRIDRLFIGLLILAFFCCAVLLIGVGLVWLLHNSILISITAGVLVAAYYIGKWILK